jgi:hypothetical protein
MGSSLATYATTCKQFMQLLVGDLCRPSLTLRYDLFYKETGGKAIDLIQSADQAGVQFGSKVMGWLNYLGLAPDWFNGFFQQRMFGASLDGGNVVTVLWPACRGASNVDALWLGIKA